jgi:hypothetical protein
LIVRRPKVALALTADPSTYLLDVCPYVLKVTCLRIDDLLWPTNVYLQDALSTAPPPRIAYFPLIMRPKNIIENP